MLGSPTLLGDEKYKWLVRLWSEGKMGQAGPSPVGIEAKGRRGRNDGCLPLRGERRELQPAVSFDRFLPLYLVFLYSTM